MTIIVTVIVVLVSGCYCDCNRDGGGIASKKREKQTKEKNFL
jgi:hypothetical protein